MNKRELRDAVRNRNGISEVGDGLGGHLDIDACVRAGLEDLSAEQRWPWLLTSAALTFTDGVAPLPADCTAISKLVIGGAVAVRVSLDEFTAEASPYVWTEQGSNVALYPTPTSAPSSPTLWYWRAEPELVDDTSSPLLPVQWHRVLVARGSYQLNMRRGQWDRAQRDEEEYGLGLRNVMQAVWASTGPRHIRSSFRAVRRARW